MGLFDQAREQAEKLRDRATEAADQARDKVAETRAGRERDRLLRELGERMLERDVADDPAAVDIQRRIRELDREQQA